MTEVSSPRTALERLSVGADVGTARRPLTAATATAGLVKRSGTAASQPVSSSFSPSAATSDDLMRLFRRGMASPLSVSLHGPSYPSQSEYRKNFTISRGGSAAGRPLTATASSSSNAGSSSVGGPGLPQQLWPQPAAQRKAPLNPHHGSGPISGFLDQKSMPAAASKGAPPTFVASAPTLVTFSRPSTSAGLRHPVEPAGGASKLIARPTSQQDNRPTVGPHRTMPYKPGTLLSPEQLASQCSRPASVMPQGFRPRTANPITHMLGDAFKPASMAGPGPGSAKPAPVAPLGAVAAPYRPTSRSGSGGQQRGCASTERISASSMRPSTSAPAGTDVSGLRMSASGRMAAPKLSSSPSAVAPGFEYPPHDLRSGEGEKQGRGQEADAYWQQPEISAAASAGSCDPLNAGMAPPRPSSVTLPGAPAFPLKASSVPLEGSALQAQESPQQTMLQLGEQEGESGACQGILGLPPRAPALVTSSSRPSSALSNFSAQAVALGHGGRAGARRQQPRCGSMGPVPEEEDVDSVDLALLRIRRDNNRYDDLRSIDIVHSLDDNGDVTERMLELESLFGGEAEGRQVKKQPVHRLAKEKLLQQQQQQLHRGPNGSVAMKAAGNRGSRGRPKLVSSALLRQAAPMVLNLEDMTGSTPEVLELELGRMSLDELLNLDAAVNVAAASHDRRQLNRRAGVSGLPRDTYR